MTAVIRVGVVGGGGRMGREVCAAVSEAPDLFLAAVVDEVFAGSSRTPDFGSPEPVGAISAPMVGAERELLAESGVEVAVDFTAADAARVTLPWCASKGIHAVVGTTGLGREDLTVLGACFTGAPANAVVAPNFAIGAVLLMRFCELAAPHMGGAEVIELHHDGKRDAPSGTALMTAERIAAARAAVSVPPWPQDAT
ncbi:MAG: 4-hydroxy-tetrahydrodipicolinate reductase, partial [Acidimicrobiales bacterium]